MQKTVIKQLSALRKVLLRVVLCYLALTLILLFFSKHLYFNFLTPWLLHLPNNSSLIATSMTAPLITPLKFSCYLSLFFILPYLLIELWLFIRPGLYQNEKKIFTLGCFSIIGLFYLGVTFAYVIIFPIFSQFIVSYTPTTILLLPDIEKLLSLSMTLLLSFGLAFETPVIIFGLIASGMVSYRKMKRARPYIFILSFIIGMLLTPPDVISQILLAVPIYLLFEAALLVCKYLLKSHSSPDKSRD